MNPLRIRTALGELAHFAIADAATVAAKWAQRTSAASQDYVDGVRNTDKDPTALAINAIPRMRTRVLEAIDSGKVGRSRPATNWSYLSWAASRAALALSKLDWARWT